MKKVEVLTQITENTKLINAIEELVSVASSSQFIMNIREEWYNLNIENVHLVNEYKTIGAIEEITDKDNVEDDVCDTLQHKTYPFKRLIEESQYHG